MRKLTVIPVLFLLTGCSSIVNIEAAEDANNPLCAEVSVRYPGQIGGLEQRWTNAQATTAYGDPSAILVRCGLEPVFASELPCVSASSIDWLVDDSNAPNFRFISFGRSPAVEVIVDSEKASGVSALDGLSQAVSKLPATAFCTEISN
jgi:uncharacterized protein YceK